jgi:hypothetical protein
MTTTRMLLATMVLALAGCYDGVGPAGADAGLDETPPRLPPGEGDDAGPDSGEPGHHGEGDAVTPGGRSVRRMTAAQFHASLVTVTGQAWPLFDDYAGAMGKADFAEITEDGRELSVTFDKFIHDAAMYSCDAAVDADLAGAEPGTILRWATVADRDEQTIRRNLDYLVLRFLGQEMKQEDARVSPWMNLLTATPEEGEIDDALMQARWIAVCVGLVTHPDFVTY